MDRMWLGPRGLHVEMAEPQDAEAIAAIHAEGFYRGWPAEDFIGFIDGRDTPTFIACDARRRIAGFATLRLAADEAELISIAVAKRWRGKGVGEALMRALLADLMHSPARRLFLEVAADNPAAIALYRKFGFAELGRRTGYYPRPEGGAATALVMGRDLG
ncbi:MAG: ribosomal protein S18-alanine N-acetyltransferase [Devosia sp.]